MSYFFEDAFEFAIRHFVLSLIFVYGVPPLFIYAALWSRLAPLMFSPSINEWGLIFLAAASWFVTLFIIGRILIGRVPRRRLAFYEEAA